MLDLKTKIWDIVFEHPIFNASWPLCTTLEELEMLWNSDSSAIMMKTCTLEAREWNPEPRYKELALWSINSMWLPNLWYKKYIEFASILKQKFEKPVIASLTWFKWANIEDNDFVEMIKEFQDNSDVDLIEINLSCPNVVGKPQIAYDFETSDKIISLVENLWEKIIWLKLPPYFDQSHTNTMSEIVKNHLKIKFLTCVNSVWNTLVIDPEKEEPLIKPKWWFWWLWWEYIKPIALANVRSFYQNLWDRVSIIWVWWILNWVDVYEFLLAWACAVQLWTTFSKEWISSFTRIKKEFENYMNKKQKKSIFEVVWKLKELN